MENHQPIDEESLLRDKVVPRGTARSIQMLSTEGLAAWQVGWKQDSAKWLLAEKEWERRARAENAKWQRFSAFVGLLGVGIGAILSWCTAILLK